MIYIIFMKTWISLKTQRVISATLYIIYKVFHFFLIKKTFQLFLELHAKYHLWDEELETEG